MSTTPFRARRLSAALASLLGTVLVATALVALPVTAASAAEPVLPETVTADSLPAPQIDGAGIVWTQAVVAGKVWAGGRFTKARPSGAAPGTQEVNRSNLLSYDLETGVLTSFSATFNGQVLGLTGSPDGSRVYVVGEFTTVNGQARNRVAAIETATGALVPTFRPSADFRVRSVVATAGTVYLAGHFGSVNSTKRVRLAAVRATDGALLPWAPTADDGQVMAITMTPDRQKIVVGGFFTTINLQPWYGMGAVDAVTGENRPWQATSVVRNAGANAAIYSLTSDATQVYGTGYHFGAGGNLENSFAAEGNTGQLAWVNGCRGDTYSGVAIGSVFYSTGHPHDCGMIGGLPQSDPWTFQRAMATTSYRGANNRTNTGGQLPGTPAPDVLHWLPSLDVGSVSGSTQAGWHITGTSDYVLVGGEFPRVNNRGQQGLARFAISAKAPDREPPQGQAEALPVLTPLAPGALRVSWTSMWDRDDAVLRWELLRGAAGASAGASQVVASGDTAATWWRRPALGRVDLSATAGQTYTYRTRFTDPDGNFYTSPGVTGTVPAGSTTPDSYGTTVQQDVPTAWWRLGEASGTTALNWAGGDDVTLATDVVRGAAGAVPGNAASTFVGSGTVPGVSTTSSTAPDVVTAEAWVKTTTIRGGKILGFGNSRTGASSSFDRHVYMTNNGRLVFGVYPGTVRTVTSTRSFNDGQWHHVVATLGASGMTLLVDGIVVGQRADTTFGRGYAGYWRIGGDSLGGWPDQPTSSAFAGSIDDVAIYPSALSVTRVRAHYEASGRTGAWPNSAPTASFTYTSTSLKAAFDGTGSTDPDGTVASYAWTFGDGATAVGAGATHTYALAGTYTARLTVTDDRGATGTTTKAVSVTAPPANQAPLASFTTSTSGLGIRVDGTGSTDPDGTLSTYAWQFGNGATGTGVTAGTTYSTGGTFTVRLTVTDDGGLTGTTTREVTVVAPPANTAFARDTFERSVSAGWGTSEVGGLWTVSARTGTASVSAGVGRLSVTPGQTATAWLAGVSQSSTDVRTVVSPASGAVGGPTIVCLIGRRVDGVGDYRVKLRQNPDGTATAQLVRTVGATETALRTLILPVGSFGGGSRLELRLQVTPEGAGTVVRSKVWAAGTAEPAAWSLTANDSTAVLQTAGAPGVLVYTSGSATSSSVVSFDNLIAVPATAP